jgi:hypothetical protein
MALLTDVEAGPVLGGVRPQTMRNWRVKGIGPVYIRIHSKIRYKMEDLEKFLEANRIEPGKSKEKRTRPRRRAA